MLIRIKSTISCHSISYSFNNTESARNRKHTAGPDSGSQAECAHMHGTAGTPQALTYFSAVPLRLLFQITNSKIGSDPPRAVCRRATNKCVARRQIYLPPGDTYICRLATNIFVARRQMYLSPGGKYIRRRKP